MSSVLDFGLVNTDKAHCQVGSRFRAGMWVILKQQQGRKRKMFVMINVDHLETATRQKKENARND